MIAEALRYLPTTMDTPIARVIMRAICLQESGGIHRVQRSRNEKGEMIAGPARGLWQFEENGGVKGVLRHQATSLLATHLCVERRVEPNKHAVWEALEHDDVLAAGFARLLLWTDPHKLPTDVRGAWDLYLRTWRPGMPRPEHWNDNYARALEEMYGR